MAPAYQFQAVNFRHTEVRFNPGEVGQRLWGIADNGLVFAAQPFW